MRGCPDETDIEAAPHPQQPPELLNWAENLVESYETNPIAMRFTESNHLPSNRNS